jgi:hypothetical protein
MQARPRRDKWRLLELVHRINTELDDVHSGVAQREHFVEAAKNVNIAEFCQRNTESG